ncbi:hypothetical protein HBH64_108900 [Parastagonospora nodorum]|nr:hypothetical protein HBH53_052170 [Parastagonospora nodorum]KAH4023741.1 hypothetical protein HBI09_163230 [Parastagonospora nodorum]KAH4202104.1 hypothetical protein HBH42_013690 [Parastagonospora nodorum]KAH4227925.1 hypothetical protein HBI06_099350 [Parastagonospora nodorum]KAH4235656.1 hypothetical protein HBI05_143410 [Parastagonospora nodorum]
MQDLAWRETRPGRWERPQSYLEKMNILTRNVPKAFGRDNWAKNAVAKLKFDPSVKDPAEYLRTAWIQVRYNHPEIAAFPHNGNYVYRIGDDVSIALWVSATFSVVEDKTVDELLGRIPRNEQMQCYYLSKTSEVLVWSPHYRVDARGAIFCLNHLIESIANLDFNLVFGGCAKNLTPSMESTLGLQNKPTPEIEAAVKKRMDALKPHRPVLDMTPTISSARPGYSQRYVIKMSSSETTEIISSCANANLAIDVVLHSALINSVAKMVPTTESRSFMASFHSNLRTLIPEGAAPKYSPISYTSVITTEVKVSPKTNFGSYYNELAPVYAKGYAPYLNSSSLFHERLAEELYAPESPKGETENQLQPRFAYLGTVDEQVAKRVGNGLVEVTDFWLGAETLTMRMMVHTWIWNGELNLSVTFNESYWDRATAATLLDGMRDTLIELAREPKQMMPSANKFPSLSKMMRAVAI